MDIDRGEGRDGVAAIDALLSWLDTDRRARLILSGDLSLRWCNAAGRALLEIGGVLTLRNGVVRTSDASEAPQFARLAREAGPSLRVHCIPLGGEGHLVIAARLLVGTPFVGLTAYPSHNAAAHHWADLGQAFGLTGSEREIVQALSRGLTADTIAKDSRTSVKTVRTHIRHAYSKLEVSSREGLFHKLAPYILAD
jgi:DNA-binding CsgD family transcriptional regulator